MRKLIDANRLQSKVTLKWVEGLFTKADMDEVFRLIEETVFDDFWIPVSRSLPDVSGEFLVAYTDESGEAEMCVSRFTHTDSEDWWELEDNYDDLTVQAWCELPPKREDLEGLNQ